MPKREGQGTFPTNNTSSGTVVVPTLSPLRRKCRFERAYVMPILKEYRIPMPMTVEEYQIGQLYTVIHASKEVTDGESAVEILENHPFEDPVLGKGQYTHKIYHIASRLPRLVQAIAPASALKLEEKAWNAYPRCKTVLSNPFLGDRFELTIETIHLADAGTTENALGLSEEQLAERRVQLIDAGRDKLTGVEEYANEKYNVAEFVSAKTGRGPLQNNWIENTTPVMCAYKLVSAKFQVFGLQTRIEGFIENTQWSVFLKFHKELFMLIDEWYGLTMEDIRRMEQELKAELDVKLDEFNLETRDQKLLEAKKPSMMIAKNTSDESASEDLKAAAILQQPSINASSPAPISNERDL